MYVINILGHDLFSDDHSYARIRHIIKHGLTRGEIMGLSSESEAYIEKLVKKYQQEGNIPGLAVGVVKDGQPVYTKGFGHANLLNKTEVTPETVFRIASISKLFTAIAVMQLVEEGKVGLHDLANNHLTSFQLRPFREKTCSITVHHLLTHTSGIGEIAPLRGYLRPGAALSMTRIRKELIPLSQFYQNRLGPDCGVGEKWCYANHGYAALGQLVADVRGQDFPTVVRERILEPLGMSHSNFARRFNVLDKMGVAYRANKKPAFDFNIITLADGALFCNIDDFSRFTSAIVSGGAPILKPETLQQMISPQFQLDERLPAMGLGFFVANPNKWGGHQIVKHDGALLGWATSSFYAPKLGLGAYAFMNTNGHAPNHIAHLIMRHLIADDDKLYPKPADPQPLIWPNLVGRYEPSAGLNSNTRLWLSYGARLTVSIENGSLMLKSRRKKWKEGVPLTPADPDDPYAFMAGSEPILFKRDLNGRIDRIQFNYHEFFRQ